MKKLSIITSAFCMLTIGLFMQPQQVMAQTSTERILHISNCATPDGGIISRLFVSKTSSYTNQCTGFGSDIEHSQHNLNNGLFLSIASCYDNRVPNAVTRASASTFPNGNVCVESHRPAIEGVTHVSLMEQGYLTQVNCTALTGNGFGYFNSIARFTYSHNKAHSGCHGDSGRFENILSVVYTGPVQQPVSNEKPTTPGNISMSDNTLRIGSQDAMPTQQTETTNTGVVTSRRDVTQTTSDNSLVIGSQEPKQNISDNSLVIGRNDAAQVLPQYSPLRQRSNSQLTYHSYCTVTPQLCGMPRNTMYNHGVFTYNRSQVCRPYFYQTSSVFC